jgi:ribose 5-phosphate isomerase A
MVVAALHPRVPLELERFGLPATLRAVGDATPRAGAPISPDGGVIADYNGAIEDRQALALRLDQIPGLVGHGLFGPGLIHDVIVGR